MAQLNKKQKEKLNDIVRTKKLFESFNALLKEHGADDLQLAYFKVEPISNKKSDASAVIAGSVTGAHTLLESPNFNVFPPLCPHGIPMIQQCSEGGKCKWVCNH